MKLKIKVEDLLKALVDVHGIAERKSINPILSNVKLVAQNNTLVLSTTDTNLYITRVINAEVTEVGNTTVPASQLLEIVKRVKSEGVLTLMLQDKHLNLESNGFKGKLPTLPAADFPESYKGDFQNIFTITCETLKFLLDKTRFAICTDETRYYLNGIYLHETSNENNEPLLQAVSTDGHKLAYASTTALPEGADNLKGIIIPKKTVDELSKILERFGNTNTIIRVSININIIVFDFPGLTLSSNLIDGYFPDYSKVIPSETNYTVSVSTKELISAIDLVSTFSDINMRAIKLQINGNILTVKAAARDGSSSGEQSITLQSTYKETLISFSSKFLLEILHLIDEDTVHFYLTTNTTPVLIKNQANTNYLFVLMPMRI